MQLEFTMLDPHIRTALPPVAGEPGKYSVAFRVPDRHGVFKFIIDYKRKGYVFEAPSVTQRSYRRLAIQTEPSAKHDCCAGRAATSQRIPPLPQSRMALLRGCHQHQPGLHYVLGALARGGPQGAKRKKGEK